MNGGNNWGLIIVSENFLQSNKSFSFNAQTKRPLSKRERSVEFCQIN